MGTSEALYSALRNSVAEGERLTTDETYLDRIYALQVEHVEMKAEIRALRRQVAELQTPEQLAAEAARNAWLKELIS